MSVAAPSVSLASFSPGGQAVLLGSREAANKRRSNEVGAEDLLASLAESGTPSGDALRKFGVTYGEVMARVHFVHGTGKLSNTFNDDDLTSNFGREGEGVIARTLMIAECLEQEPATEAHLLHALIGNQNHGNRAFQIVSDSGDDIINRNRPRLILAEVPLE